MDGRKERRPASEVIVEDTQRAAGSTDSSQAVTEMKCNEPLKLFCFTVVSGVALSAFLSPSPSGNGSSEADFPLRQAEPTHVVFLTNDGEDKTLDLTFDNLKFDIEKDQPYDESMLTDEIREMEGKRIKIHGFIRPSFKQKGIKSFVFVRDNKECCFGPGAALYDCLIVKMKKGKSATFTVRPIAVEGEFSIKPYEGPDGNTWAIFQLTDSVVD